VSRLNSLTRLWQERCATPVTVCLTCTITCVRCQTSCRRWVMSLRRWRRRRRNWKKTSTSAPRSWIVQRSWLEDSAERRSVGRRTRVCWVRSTSTSLVMSYSALQSSRTSALSPSTSDKSVVINSVFTSLEQLMLLACVRPSFVTSWSSVEMAAWNEPIFG